MAVEEKMMIANSNAPDMVTITISVAALVVSVLSLGWNFYRDVVLKARVRVEVNVSRIHDGGGIHGPYITIAVTNYGPGPVHIDSIYMAKSSWLRFFGGPLLRLTRRQNQYCYIMDDYTNPDSAKLPKKLDVGERLALPLPMNKDSSLAVDPTHFGVVDSVGRIHWATRASLRRARSQYFETFPRKPWGVRTGG